MVTKPPYTKATNRNSAQLDGTVDLTNYEEDDSERVQGWTATAPSPHEGVPARVDLRSQPRKSGTVRESGDAEIDARIHVPDDGPGVSSIRDGGGKGASTIDETGNGEVDWRVVVKHDEQNGLVRLDVERVD